MRLGKIRRTIENAIFVAVQGIRLPGIEGADVQAVNMPLKQLRRVAAQLEQERHSDIILAAEVELFIRISNIDALSSIESTEFQVAIEADGNGLRAVASTDKNWARAWERGIEPIRTAALQSMKEGAWSMGASLAEDSYTFQTAMVLLASELVGPYFDRIATLLGYSPGLVQVIAARLHEAQIGNRTKFGVNAGSIREKAQLVFCWIGWWRKVSSSAAGRKKRTISPIAC